MANESRYISRYTGKQIDRAYETVKGITSDDEGKIVKVDAEGCLATTDDVMPQRLSVLPSLDSSVPNSRIVLATYDTDPDSSSTGATKITLNELSARVRPTIITTAGTTVPADAQEGQYIFLEKTNDNNLGGN